MSDSSRPSDPDSGGVEATQSFYTRWALVYDAVARHTPGVGGLREAAVDALAPDPGDTVVEMGCGTGANLPYLRERVGPEGRVLGVDFTPGVVRVARDRIAGEEWENVGVARGDATRPPVDAAEVDAVFASFVSGMLADPAAAVRDWASLAGPGGRVGLLDLARSTRASGAALNLLFRGLVVASAPPGSRFGGGESPTRTLDRRVAAAHRELRSSCSDLACDTRALGFARVSAGTVRNGDDGDAGETT